MTYEKVEKRYYLRSRHKDRVTSFGIYINAPGPRVEVARFEVTATCPADEALRLAREHVATLNGGLVAPDPWQTRAGYFTQK